MFRAAPLGGNIRGRKDSNAMTDDDRHLFRTSIGPVDPVKDERAPTPRSRPAPKPRQSDDEPLPWEDLFSDGGEPVALDDFLEFQRPGLQYRVMSRLRQGKCPIERDLDLHGQTVEEARRRLLLFLAAAAEDGVRCARIVHGKGYRSPEQMPRLKSKVAHWLSQCPQVLAYCSTQPRDGGTGAVYVLLRQDRR